MGYLFIDTGAFYRAITLAAIEAGLADAEEPAIVALAEHTSIKVTADRNADERQYTVLLNSRDVTHAIRDPSVEANVSRISAMPLVRQAITDQQRRVAEAGRVIMAGRDIGTTVLPNADLKLYLDASPATRAERRYRQILAEGRTVELASIEADLQARDVYDSTREASPLRRAADAIEVITDSLSVEQVVAKIKQIIAERSQS